MDSVVQIKLDESLDQVHNDLGRASYFTVNSRANTTRSTSDFRPNFSNFYIRERSQIYVPQEEDYIFTDYCCDICDIYPIRNVRYHCISCDNYDICSDCYRERRNEHPRHGFEEVDGRKLHKEQERRALELTQKHSIDVMKGKLSLKTLIV